jgi:hypothetical protein
LHERETAGGVHVDEVRSADFLDLHGGGRSAGGGRGCIVLAAAEGEREQERGCGDATQTGKDRSRAILILFGVIVIDFGGCCGVPFGRKQVGYRVSQKECCLSGVA